MGRNVFWGEMSWGEMSFGEKRRTCANSEKKWGEMSFGEKRRGEKRHGEKCHLGRNVFPPYFLGNSGHFQGLKFSKIKIESI